VLLHRNRGRPIPSRTPSRLPKYRHYKPKDLAVVRLDGEDHYLGRYGSEESRETYRRLIAERWKVNPPGDLISNAAIGRVLWLMAETETDAGRAFWQESDKVKK
jgi:hypothetical protein